MSLALVAGRAMEKLMIACLYELGRWRRDYGLFLLQCMYFTLAGLAVQRLRGLLTIENDWAVWKSELACF
jgi:hypothetical protein